jgi:hypothetical protein
MSSLIDKRKAALAGKRAALKSRFGGKKQSSAELNQIKIDELDKKWTVPVEDELPIGNVAGHLPEHVLIERSPKRRHYIAGKRHQELSALIGGCLPEPDTDYFIVAAGRGKRPGRNDIVQSFGFGNFIDFVTGQFGAGCVVYMSTWSMNRDHALMLLEFLDSGVLSELHVLCDPAFTMRKNGIMMMLKHGIDRFEGSEYKTFKNHSKIYCIRDRAGDRFCTIMGSANLSGTPRAENYILSTDPAMYRHFVENFFEVMFRE